MSDVTIVLGATGRVGSTVVRALLQRGKPVIAVTHDPKKVEPLRRLGAQGAIADVFDVAALRSVFHQGERLFLLNPPAPPSTDTATEERRSVDSILAAVEGSGLKRIVAQSTYGAQPGDRIGDLGVLYAMEQALAAGAISYGIVRAAYLMSNWDAALESAKETGKVPTLYPPDFRLPMVAPKDVGRVAARLLADEEEPRGVLSVEGPERCSSADVAAAFAQALGRKVEAVETPREEWPSALKRMGFSHAAAESMIRMTERTREGENACPDADVRGETSLAAYVAGLVSAS